MRTDETTSHETNTWTTGTWVAVIGVPLMCVVAFMLVQDLREERQLSEEMGQHLSTYMKRGARAEAELRCSPKRLPPEIEALIGDRLYRLSDVDGDCRPDYIVPGTPTTTIYRFVDGEWDVYESNPETSDLPEFTYGDFNMIPDGLADIMLEDGTIYYHVGNGWSPDDPTGPTSEQ